LAADGALRGRAVGLLRRVGSDSLLRNSVYVMGTTIVNSALGYVYWVIAARSFSPAEVGLATALVAAMTMTALLSNMGIGHALVQRLPRRKEPAEWSLTVTTAAALAGGASLAGGVVAIGILGATGTDLSTVSETGYALVFAAAVIAWTLSSVLDFVFIAQRQAGKMLARNALLSLLKIPLLLLPFSAGADGALVIFGTWAAATVVVGVVTWFVLIGRSRPGFRPRLRGARGEARTMSRYLVGHHLINLGSASPMYLFPLLVTARLGASANAYFYVGWMVGGIFFLVSPAVAASLFAEGAHDPQQLGQKLRTAARFIALLLTPAMIICLAGGHLILSAFGADYADESYVLLALLVASAVPDAVTNLAVSALRVRERLGLAATLTFSMLAIAAIAAWVLLPELGIEAVGWAWLGSQTAGALVVGVVVLARRRR
jgi:O-antigen/teichoic acid export membrane protein